MFRSGAEAAAGAGQRCGTVPEPEAVMGILFFAGPDPAAAARKFVPAIADPVGQAGQNCPGYF